MHRLIFMLVGGDANERIWQPNVFNDSSPSLTMLARHSKAFNII